MNNNKLELLEQVQKDIVERQACAGLAKQAKNLVMGAGDVDAQVMLVGEAPGRKEDELGLPFVGVAGKILDELLATINLIREQVYITNIVKYRPPNNRDPLPGEKAVFWPYLVRQIEIVNPQVIVTLGRHSLSYFLPETLIGQVHGQGSRVQVGNWTGVVFSSYHPAATIYNRSLRGVVENDFQELLKILIKNKVKGDKK